MACENLEYSMGTRSEPLLARLMRVLENKGWILRLPPGAQLWHQEQLVEVAGEQVVPDPATPPNTRTLKKTSAVPALLKHSSMLRDVANDI